MEIMKTPPSRRQKSRCERMNLPKTITLGENGKSAFEKLIPCSAMELLDSEKFQKLWLRLFGNKVRMLVKHPNRKHFK